MVRISTPSNIGLLIARHSLPLSPHLLIPHPYRPRIICRSRTSSIPPRKHARNSSSLRRVRNCGPTLSSSTTEQRTVQAFEPGRKLDFTRKQGYRGDLGAYRVQAMTGFLQVVQVVPCVVTCVLILSQQFPAFWVRDSCYAVLVPRSFE